jgi:membrane protein DedA with SNARE-associated domain
MIPDDGGPGKESGAMDVQELIRTYGDLTYGLVFLWTLIEGETIVLLTGIAARQGMLSLPALIACAWTGTFLCDQIGFALGRRCGHRVIARWPRLRAGVERALALLERHSTGFIFAFRFIYGVRNVSSLAMGMSQLSWTRFAVLNFLAAGLWAVSFAGVGYLAGPALIGIAEWLVAAFGLGMCLLFLLVLAVALVAQRQRNARARRAGLPRRDYMPPG